MYGLQGNSRSLQFFWGDYWVRSLGARRLHYNYLVRAGIREDLTTLKTYSRNGANLMAVKQFSKVPAMLHLHRR